MSQVFPDECVLSKEDRNVFLDTRFPDEFPCEGCPRLDCEIKTRIHTACVMGKDIEEDFHSITCGRCGGRIYAWKISGKSRTWYCKGDNDGFPCTYTYTLRAVLSEW